MMKFIDGPAAGKCLALRRTPLLLRVAFNPKARSDERAWDALNDPEDAAKPHEQLHAYILNGKPNVVHVRMRTRSESGFFGMGEYNYLGPMADGLLRDNGAWNAWCGANRSKLQPEWYRRHLDEKANDGEETHG